MALNTVRRIMLYGYMDKLKVAADFAETDLIKKIVQGETTLYEVIIRRYNPLLHKTGRAFGFNHADTQDLMQESFVNAYLNLPGFEHRSSFKTWILKIMIRNCSKKKSKLSFKNEPASLIYDNSTPMFSDHHYNDVNKEIVNRELCSLIEQAVGRLPSEYGIVFTLREVNGLSVAETADALGITESNVKVRLHRAKAMLRKELEKSYSPTDIFEFNLIYCDAMVNRVMNVLISMAN